MWHVLQQPPPGSATVALVPSPGSTGHCGQKPLSLWERERAPPAATARPSPHRTLLRALFHCGRSCVPASSDSLWRVTLGPSQQPRVLRSQLCGAELDAAPTETHESCRRLSLRVQPLVTLRQCWRWQEPQTPEGTGRMGDWGHGQDRGSGLQALPEGHEWGLVLLWLLCSHRQLSRQRRGTSCGACSSRSPGQGWPHARACHTSMGTSTATAQGQAPPHGAALEAALPPPHSQCG